MRHVDSTWHSDVSSCWTKWITIPIELKYVRLNHKSEYMGCPCVSFLDISANVDRACNGNELSIPVTSLMEKRAVHIEAKFQSDKRLANGKNSKGQNGVGN